MKTTGLALVIGCAAALLLSGAGGCGGVTASLGDGDAGPDGQAGSSSGGSSSSSGGGSTSSSGGSSSGSGGGSSSGGSSSSSGVSSSSSSSSSGGTSSSSGSSSGGSSSSSGGGPTGTIYFQQCTGSALCASSQFSFYAGFFPTTPSQGCTVTQNGSCSSYSCSTSTAQNGVSAGTLTISGGSIGTVTVMPDSTGTYTYQATGAKYAAGQTLTVSASGATVPAFGPDTVVAPGLPSLLYPTLTGTSYTIPTTVDLTVAWSGGVPGAVLIFEGTTGGSQSYFTCEWPASQGKASVPRAVLAPLAGQTGGYVIYGQYAATTFNAGGYAISEAALPFSGAMASFQ